MAVARAKLKNLSRRQRVKTEPSPPIINPPATAPLDAQVEPSQQTQFTSRIKISTDSLKAIFTKSRAEREETEDGKKTNRLLDLITARIRDGRTSNLKNFRIWAAIDQAYDAPFNQITPTLLRHIMSRGLSEADMLKELHTWGLSEETLFVNQTLPDGRSVKVLSEQTFYKTLVPVVKAYLTIRLAKLFNDRNQYPFLKYEPFVSTEVNRTICEIVTNLVERMSHQYGFPPVLRQAIFQALMYSMSLVFPMEAWHHELDVDDKGEEFCKKEGLRYSIPHPSRMFWDMNYRLSSFNTDSGCTYAAYWRLMRYGDVFASDLYWNTDKIPYGTNWWSPTLSYNYFTEVYPCAFPSPLPAGAGINPSQRDDAAAWYRSSDLDKAVFVTDYFMKLVPKNWGLGDWKYNVWFRFTLASDDTVIFAEPLPYCPVLYLGYEADENRSRNPSMALEIIPWQDHLGNIISQILLSAKQNIAKIVYYDSNMVNTVDIDALKTQQRDASGIVWVPFDSLKAARSQIDTNRIFNPIQFPVQDTVALTNVMGTVITLMERLLGMSSSEVGATASHVQTAEEIRVVANNTSTRVDYTGTFVDDFMDAWKRQLYESSQAFMDEEFVAEVSAVPPENIEALKKIGFEFGPTYDGKQEVKGKKSMLAMEAFVSTRDGVNRINNPQTAQVILQTVQALANLNPQHPLYAQMLELVNMAGRLGGVPKDAKVKFNAQSFQAQNLQNMQQQLGQMVKAIQQSSAQQAVQATMKAAQPIAQAVQEQGKELQQVSQETQQQEAINKALAEKINQLQSLVTAAIQQSPSVPSPGTYHSAMAA